MFYSLNEKLILKITCRELLFFIRSFCGDRFLFKSFTPDSFFSEICF
ncbi:hypothetical protein LEP1GSC039_3044 [Leptospira santarosai str. 2000027870]|nr:hypothetical protein LEP1GSC039_3044 [Leptospira santarosai str. 2000027870]